MQEKSKKWLTAVMFIVGTILSWGGTLYATKDALNFRPIGIVISLLGYGVFFGAAMLYETIDDECAMPIFGIYLLTRNNETDKVWGTILTVLGIILWIVIFIMSA